MQTPNKSNKKLLMVNHKIKVFHRIFTLVIILEIKISLKGCCNDGSLHQSTKYHRINYVPEILDESEPYICSIWPCILKDACKFPFSVTEWPNIAKPWNVWSSY